MNDVKWIKLTTTMFDNEKIKLIESLPAGDSILIVWIKLLTLAGKTNAGGFIYLTQNIPYTDDMLATMFSRKLNIIILALKTFEEFGMIERDENNRIFIPNWEKHQNIEGLEKIREQGRLRQKKHRDKQSKLLGCNVTVTEKITLHNAPEEEREEDKNKKEEILLSEFEKFWNLYNKKTGKEVCLKKWKRLTVKEKESIFSALPAYVKSTPDKTYRKNPSKWLLGKHWEDEIQINNNFNNPPNGSGGQDLQTIDSNWLKENGYG